MLDVLVAVLVAVEVVSVSHCHQKSNGMGNEAIFMLA
jgi:hypothetical protein